MAESIEQRFHDLGAFIREQRRTASLSVRKLSELAGISNPYLSQIERGLRKPSAEILQQIANGLRISAETLYVRAGFLEQRDLDDPDLEGAITRQSTLSREHQGPRAVLNALERLATAYGSECVRVRQDLSIAEGQLREYKSRLGKPFALEAKVREAGRLKAASAAGGDLEFGLDEQTRRGIERGEVDRHG